MLANAYTVWSLSSLRWLGFSMPADEPRDQRSKCGVTGQTNTGHQQGRSSAPTLGTIKYYRGTRGLGEGVDGDEESLASALKAVSFDDGESATMICILASFLDGGHLRRGSRLRCL